MNKRNLISLSAALSMGLCSSMTGIAALENPQILLPAPQKENVMDADAFIDTYAGDYESIDSEFSDLPDDIASEFVWIKKADKSNYKTLLAGYDVFVKLSKTVQKQIRADYADLDLDYDTLIAQAKKVKASIEKEAVKTAESTKSTTEAKQETTEGQQPKAETDAAVKEETAPAAAASQPEAKTETPAAKDEAIQPEVKQEEQKRETENQEAATTEDSSKQEVKEQTVKEDAAKAEETKKTEDKTAEAAKTDHTDAKAQGDLASKEDASSKPADQNAADTVKPADKSEAETKPSQDKDQTEGKEDTSDETKPAEDVKPAEETKPAEKEDAEKPSSVILYSKPLDKNVNVTWTGTLSALSEDKQAALDAALAQKGLKSKNVYARTLLGAASDLYKTIRTDLSGVELEDGSIIPVGFKEDDKGISVLFYSLVYQTVDFADDSIELKQEDSIFTPAKTEIPAQKDEQEAREEDKTSDTEKAGDETSAKAKGEDGSAQEEPVEITEETMESEAVLSSKDNKISEAKTALAALAKTDAIGYSTGDFKVLSGNKADVLDLNVIYNQNSDNFVNTYCSRNGVIFKMANTTNYQQILNGYTVWRSLSQSEKAAVNNKLSAAGSSRYQDLYIQANRIRLSLPSQSTGSSNSSGSTTTRPSTPSYQLPGTNTATDTDSSLWMILLGVGGLGLAACIFMLLAGKNKKNNTQK